LDSSAVAQDEPAKPKQQRSDFFALGISQTATHFNLSPMRPVDAPEFIPGSLTSMDVFMLRQADEQVHPELNEDQAPRG
jgi:hypothetical protein